MSEGDEQQPAAAAPGSLGLWWRQGLRSALFRRPDWRGLRATPTRTALLLLSLLAVQLLAERLYIAGPASFYWPALWEGWIGTLVLAWACWWLRPRSEEGSSAALFSLLIALALPITLITSLVLVPAVRLNWHQQLGPWGWWGLWGAATLWLVAAQWLLLWRSDTTAWRRWPAGLLVAAAAALPLWVQPSAHWYAEAIVDERPARLRLTQELLELQPALLERRLQALQAGRSGEVELYSITFAPYAPEDVFRNESALVDGLMQDRFGAQGRSLQLVNHPGTALEHPWATALNLQRAIRQMAALMNRDEDILFIHLTSHGAQDGKLAASLDPLALDEVTPQMLKTWLDEAGIRWRLLSVSACYSGSWIAPLAGPGSLVMSAADAEHTSYGCGKGSELTFFGRAMYAEQLRLHTLSFEAAHAAARPIIDAREQEAGKTDGYSNPQISVGEGARRQVALLVERLGRRGD
ncbi:C13 family peptidase [Paucibacter sp. O1-1]|nr:C13 family peptidase [Paucibacter sp. O1-1]MDA3829794.1 C13 family peptidase [Paucibacter sp. O1-1]